MNLEQDKTDLVIGLASTATSRGSSSSSPKKNQPVKTDSTENTSNPPLTSSTVMASAASVNDSQDNETDICRVCRCEETPDKPLFYPCVCTGSIKYIHQECLVQWLKYSKKEYCELCKHKFTFAPIYHPNMPKRLPAKDIITGLLKNILKAIKFWLHSTLVAISWLAIVPLTASRIYRCLFAGSVSSLLTLPLDMLSTENIISDILQGGFVVLCSLGAFISLVWLREQILSGGGPDWLENPRPNNNNNNDNNANNPILNQNANNIQRMNRIRMLQQRNRLRNLAANEAIQNANNPVDNVNNQVAVDNNNENLPRRVNELHEHDLNQIEQNVNANEQNANNVGGVDPVLNQQQQQQQQQNAQAQANDDNHWNPMEWDRAAEDLTWDRLLGLDGSLLFLEHVFWVISLNTLFILVFAFCPFHLGHYMIYALKFHDIVEKTHFEGLITTIVGYILLAILLVGLYASMAFSTFHRARKVIGLCYIVIKVALLVIFEICVFPLISGMWLDICSLKLFNSTISDRLNSFEHSPGTSVFIHWLVGMIYVFYFATFVFLLREVLRPGILWFLRNLNDPDFNPVQEMIQLPVFRHIRRFLTSVTLFGFSIILIFWLPIQIIKSFSANSKWPILPYNMSQPSETLSSELSIELLWLHVVLPALLEQSHIRTWIKNFIKLWAVCVAWLLGIKSFLLGEPENKNASQNNANNENNNNNNNNNGVVQQPPIAQNPFQFNIGVAHQALLQNNQPFVKEPYYKPPYFGLRIGLFLLILCGSLCLSSICTLVVPVSIGRWVIYWLTDSAKLNELYTIITGLYSIWIAIRVSTIVYNWVQMGVYQLFLKFKERIKIVVKSTLASLMIFGFLPVLFGLLFQQIVINPISCNIDQTPVTSIWQVWALGVLHTKISTALILTGPQWWLRQAIDRICQDGIRNIDLKFMLFKLVYPVTVCLGLALAVPCIISRSIAPLFLSDQNTLILIERRIYPVTLFMFSFIFLFVFQIRQFKRLYERIRNDKYLVGQRLINFERGESNKANKEPATSN